MLSLNSYMYNEKVYCLGTYPLCDPSHAMYAGVQEAKRLGVPLTIHAGRNNIFKKYSCWWKWI